MIAPRLVFCHSSDEHYGADRVLLDVVAALDQEELTASQIWLPTDIPHTSHPLCRTLETRGARVRHVDMPVMRRAYLSPRGAPRLARRLVGAAGELRRQRPDGVYCTTSAGFLMAPVARALGVPRVVGHVQELWSPADARILGQLALACHELVCISDAVRRSLPDRLVARSHVVLNSTPDLGHVVDLEGREGPLEFLMSGRWNAWKGHATLLDAWDGLAVPGRLVILGGPPDSGEKVDVPALARRLHAPGSVEIVGQVRETGTYVDHADVVLVPSDLPEPFGLVAIEAFARGRPVVGSDDGGLAEIVTHGHDGWLFPRGDGRALRDLIAGLTRAEITDAGRRARETYAARFTRARYSTEWRRAVLPDRP